MLAYNRKESKHNREISWEIPKSILGKFSSIIDRGLTQIIKASSIHKDCNII